MLRSLKDCLHLPLIGIQTLCSFFGGVIADSDSLYRDPVSNNAECLQLRKVHISGIEYLYGQYFKPIRLVRSIQRNDLGKLSGDIDEPVVCEERREKDRSESISSGRFRGPRRY